MLVHQLIPLSTSTTNDVEGDVFYLGKNAWRSQNEQGIFVAVAAVDPNSNNCDVELQGRVNDDGEWALLGIMNNSLPTGSAVGSWYPTGVGTLHINWTSVVLMPQVRCFVDGTTFGGQSVSCWLVT